MKHGQPSLFDQKVYEPGQVVTVTITGTVSAVRPAGHDQVVLDITTQTRRPDHKQVHNYVVVGDDGIVVALGGQERGESA